MPESRPDTSPTERPPTPGERVRYIQAVNLALHWALETDPTVIVLGEDVAKPGGPFGATRGLHEKFGSRVIDTPISEAAMVGGALGAAMVGMRPIVEIMYGDFIFVAMDQLVNHVANTRYVSQGAWTAPLVIRTQAGWSPGAGPQHTRSIEAFLCHVPGLRVGAPSDAQDAYRMLRSAISSDDPAVVIEHRMLYPEATEVVLDEPIEPCSGALIRRPGSDVTVIAWSRMVGLALRAAADAQQLGLNVEVLDLRWLAPIDMDAIRDSVARTGRVVITHEAVRTAGLGAEIAARIAEECLYDLRAPIARVAALDVPVPAAASLQERVIPAASAILEGIRRVTADA